MERRPAGGESAVEERNSGSVSANPKKEN